MSAAAPKKQVRFARTEQSDGDGDNDDQEEDTLFDKRQDAQRGSPGLRTGARRRDELGSEEVAVRGSRTGGQADVSRWPVTAVLCASFLGLGMSIAVLGPTLEDLAINVNKNISNISYIFVGRALGYIGGSVVAGVLFDCVNHYLLLGFSMLATAFGMFAVPFCKKPLLLTALMCSVGVSMGFLDTVRVVAAAGRVDQPRLSCPQHQIPAPPGRSPGGPRPAQRYCPSLRRVLGLPQGLRAVGRAQNSSRGSRLGKHPSEMPKTPQLAPLALEEQHLCSEALPHC